MLQLILISSHDKSSTMKSLLSLLLVVLLMECVSALIDDCQKDQDCLPFECCVYDPRPIQGSKCKPRTLYFFDYITKRDSNGQTSEGLLYDGQAFNKLGGQMRSRDVPEGDYFCETFRYCREDSDCLRQEFCDVRFNTGSFFRQGVCLLIGA